MTCEFLKI